MDYEFISSPNYTPAHMAESVWGHPRIIRSIVIHWWDDPNNNPKLATVVGHFQIRASQVSAHYVVNDERIVQLVREQDAAWHAKQANPFSIGIECDPNGGEGMYQLLGQLVREIRARHGNLPLEPHSKYVTTRCPGTIDLAKIDKYAGGGDMTTTDERIEDLKRHVLSLNVKIEDLKRHVLHVETSLPTRLVPVDTITAPPARVSQELAPGESAQLTPQSETADTGQLVSPLQEHTQLPSNGPSAYAPDDTKPSSLLTAAKAYTGGLMAALGTVLADPAVLTEWQTKGWKAAVAAIVGGILVYKVPNKKVEDA